MLKKIGLSAVIVLVLFLGFVATGEGKFHYERSGVINVPAEQIYPYISNFTLGAEWSPYEKIDPNMKKEFRGQIGQVGSVMEFKGNSEAGSGKLEILKLIPNEFVEIKLTMTEPIFAENIVQYKLTPEGNGTRFSWIMMGDGGFMGKLINVFIDCEKMVADQFSVGINNLKTLLEKQA